ncbi:AAC-rich mRNA clone AAC11 protein-like [Drosophila ficusphila]|uniref:AAC-rich mRNA clone AAC11 protein-like n=1 Tax=Drosophila ficusphila TaxID=30025 RepID=UPI001C8ACFF8|nr:AAC-rich mRNA clone AAC11 protein-like [Drosophila ficusphila]
MPAMLEPLILGMDFLASIGTTLRCGTASLTLSRRSPGEDEPTRRIGTEHGNHTEPPPRPRPRRPLSHENTPRTSSTPSTEPRLGIANHDIGGPQNDRVINVPKENNEENTENNEENTENNEENTENNEENTENNEEDTENNEEISEYQQRTTKTERQQRTHEGYPT